VSPTAGRELAWRLTGDSEAAAAGITVVAIAATLQEMWKPVLAGDGQPGVVEEEGVPVGFAAYPVHFRGTFVPTDTLSAALQAYYASPQVQTGPSQADAYASQRANVRFLLQRARRQVERRLEALAGDEPAPGEAERVRTAAEWLLALSSQVVPGQEVLEVPLDGTTIRIALDATLKPVAQAERMFARAAKLERAARFIPVRRHQLQQDLAFLDQLDLDLVRAENQPEIAAVREDLRAAGLLTSQTSKRAGPHDGHKPGAPLRFRSAQGMEILVGRNARQNELGTFDLAHPDDLWLHARDVPGAHVVVRAGGGQPDESTIRDAAQLAAYHSGARGERAVDVIVTRRRAVSRAPGGKIGQVLVRQEEVWTVVGELPASVR
jgi:predicted ribosome quality control (RQC) complex YloA/Tae2 family protein